MSDVSLEGIACTSVFILRGDTVLLGLRHYSDTHVVWTTPGGKGDPGESSEDAVRRETAEEVGVTDLRDLRLIGSVPVAPIYGLGGTLDVYLATTPQEHRNVESHKFSEWKYVPLDAIPDSFINPPALRLVLDCLQKAE